MTRKNRNLIKTLNGLSIVKKINSFEQTGKVVQMINNSESEMETEPKKYFPSTPISDMGNGYRTIPGSKTALLEEF